MMTYKNFLKQSIDLSPVGVERNENAPLYFCTPKGARIIGWAGVDGIHYCFVHGFANMVFAISPMNAPGEYVHPIAKDFTDFLRLILACGDAVLLEQAWAWDEVQFDAYLAENTPSDTQCAVLSDLREKLRIAPMEQPFVYLKTLHSEFDYSSIPYTRDYYDFYEEIRQEPELPLWKVWFEGGFWEHQEPGRPGTSIPLKVRFDWDGNAVYIPSAYSCAKGLVVDICIEVAADQIRSFIDKWQHSPEKDGSDFSDEQQMQARAENPLSVPYTPEIMMNGRALRYRHGCSISWNPCFKEENDRIAKATLEHYGLDPECGWIVSRYSFPWERSRRPQMRTLSLKLQAESTERLGIRFRILSAGEHVDFTHPLTGTKHTLTIHEYEHQQIPEGSFGDDSYEYPIRLTAMSYTISPGLPKDTFSLIDRVPGDRPRKKQQAPSGPETSSDCAIGIIGVAGGPTTIFATEGNQSEMRTVCSSLHFDEQYEMEWHMVFHEKRRSDMTVDLL